MRQMRGRGVQALIAFVLALLLWTYVSFSMNPSVDQDRNAPVTILNIPAGLVLVNPATNTPILPTTEVRFRVSGPRDLVQAIPTPAFRARLDLTGLGAGEHVVPVRLDPQSGLHTYALVPPSINIRLEPLAQRTVRISVKSQGQVPFVYASGPVRQQLEQAMISGPAALVKQVALAQAVVPLQNQTSDVDIQVDLQPVDQAGMHVAGVVVTPARVEIMVAVTPKVQSQQAAVVPSIVGSLPPGYVYGLEWEPKFVKVLAATSITGTLETEPITITGLTSSVTRMVRLAAKQNLITDPPDLPIMVRLSINPIGVQQQLILALPIAPINIGEGLNALASPLTISVTLSGPFQQLAKLSFKQIPVTVDLRGRGPGTYHLPVEITVPAGLERVAPTKLEVTITLTPQPTPIPTPAPATPAAPSSTAGP